MNKYLNYLIACLLSLAALSSCSDDNEQTSVPVPEPTPSGYCLMFYAAGCCADFDITLMESARQAAEATGDDVAATILFKASGKAEGEAHNGTRRYTAQDGVMTQDATFGTVDDFAVTDPARLAEFIRWSAEQYPNRRYLLVFGGEGYAFDPDYEQLLPEVDTRATLYNSGKVMTSAQLGDAIRQSGITLEALIAHSGQQASIEMLAEWEGTADYLLSEPFYTPDIAYDYSALIADLRQGRSVEETLKRTAQRAINLWQQYYDEDELALMVEVTRLRDLTPLWDVLRETFDMMHASMNKVNVNKDEPSVTGQTYGQGYMRALRLAYKRDWDDFYDYMRPYYTVDLVDYLHSALTHSGNLNLAPYINRLDEVLADIIVAHHQTDGNHDHFFNVYTAIRNYFEDEREAYRQCRFEQLTGWGNFYESLLDYVYALPDEQGDVLTPIAENILGKWKIVARAYKEYGEWMEAPLNDISGTLTFRPNGELFEVYSSGNGTTILSVSNWGNPNDEDFTFEMEGYKFRIFNLTENMLDFGPAVNDDGIPRYLCRRIDDEPQTTSERLVGRWTLSQRFQKVNGEWEEITADLPAECWCEYTENGTYTTYTRWPDGKEWLNKDMRWRMYEEPGIVEYFLPDGSDKAYFRVSLEANGSRMVMNYAEDYDPNLTDQLTTEYKDILIKVNE